MDWKVEFRRSERAPLEFQLVVTDMASRRRATAFVKWGSEAEGSLNKACYTVGLSDRQIRQAATRWALEKLEKKLATGAFEIEENGLVPLELNHSDVDSIARRGLAKACYYQVEIGRDLFCSTASAEDPRKTHFEGPRVFAVTSRRLCDACDLPHTDFLCSSLLHPSVKTLPDGMRRTVMGAICDVGKPEVDTGSKCHPGGNQCWHRAVKSEALPPPPAYRGGSLPQALDFLDAVWRARFARKDRLLVYRSAVSMSDLEKSCVTRTDLESRLSGLADLFKLLSIPDDLVDDESIPRDQTFNRLRACLRKALGPDDTIQVEKAVEKLKAVNELRVAKQHSTTTANEVSAMKALGISSDVSPNEYWDSVRAKVVEALSAIAQELNRNSEI